MRRASGGSSLATALVVMAILLTLGFTAAGMSSSNLSLTTRSVQAQVARNLAEAAISRALARLCEDPEHGLGPQRAAIPVEFASTPRAAGWLTFDREEARRLGLPYSTNNLHSDSSAAGWHDAVLPGQCAHLVGTGRAGDLEHRVEAIVFLPAYPYAVASSGTIFSNGGLEVCAVDGAGAVVDGVSLEEGRPGAMASNSASLAPRPAIELQGLGVSVTGDVQAAGDIRVAREVHVGGEVRSRADKVVLPDINLSLFDTRREPDLLTLAEEQFPQLTISGYARRKGLLQVSQGLALESGVLYVEGDLEVRGGISGTGAVIVTGTTHVQGDNRRAAADEKVALLSGGDVDLQGTASRRQSFQGLIYTEGDLSSRFLNLSGVFIANKRGEGGSRVTLDDSRVNQFPLPGVNFEVPISASPAPRSEASPGPFVGSLVQVQLDNSPGVGGPPAQKFANLRVDVARLVRNPATGRLGLPPDKFSALSWEIVDGGRLVARVAAQGIRNLPELGPYWGGGAGGSVLSADCSVDWNGITGSPELEQLLSGLRPGQELSRPPGGGASRGNRRWSLDLSRYMQLQDRMRILLWRDV